MGNVLKPEKQEQIRALGRLGWTLRRIEEATGVRRETVSRYLRWAGIRVRPPRKRSLEPSKAASEVTPDSGGAAKPASEVTTDLERPRRSGAVVPSRCEVHRERITAALEAGRNAKSIWEDLVDEHAFEGRYESVKRFVRKLRTSAIDLAHPTIVTAPGEESQVDYGDGPMVRHPDTGKYRRTRLFALTLGWCRKAVWLLAWKSSSRIWCELHAEAFRRLGGATGVVVHDNLKEGVLAPDIYDPVLNPLYRDFLTHYGVVALPARVRHPDRKGKVESSIGFAQRTPLRGKRFESLEEAQAYLDRWTERWADTRIHGTTKRQVAAMFAEEQPKLLPLPLEPFRFYQYAVRTVHLDGCVEIEAAYYGTPPGWIGREIGVQWDELTVRLVDRTTGELLREHRKRPRGWRAVHPDDRPARTPLSTLTLLARARNAGTSIGNVCEAIHERSGEGGVRRVLGVLSLAKKHGVAAAEDACRVALEIGVPNYRFVRKWIERHPSAPLSLRQVDPLIRELSQYRELVSKLTSSSESP
jgi:transposase